MQACLREFLHGFFHLGVKCNQPPRKDLGRDDLKQGMVSLVAIGYGSSPKHWICNRPWVLPQGPRQSLKQGPRRRSVTGWQAPRQWGVSTHTHIAIYPSWQIVAPQLLGFSSLKRDRISSFPHVGNGSLGKPSFVIC